MNSVLLVAAIPSEAMLFALAVLHTVLHPFGTESSRIVDTGLSHSVLMTVLAYTTFLRRCASWLAAGSRLTCFTS
jgi:hypothetical protein